jgi:hypothetical protein
VDPAEVAARLGVDPAVGVVGGEEGYRPDGAIAAEDDGSVPDWKNSASSCSED